MLTSILYRATPDDVRLIMIDPKRLELGMYEEIPHLLTPVVVDPKKAANALRWAVREMEERYKTLAAEGVRNIEQYNRNIRLALQERGAAAATDPEAPKPLPFIVVVIDELADLMMVASNEVEESICRLAQMARAVGIHLILATQRPSVDVITGLIKANLPSRISFRVSSKTDSRTILDGNGAEQLLGKGDMLFMPPASSRCIRLHGPYISEQESARLASFLRKQGKPVFDDTITAEDEEKSGPGNLEFEKDELFDEAARIVVTSGQVSISYLQRKLRVGFSRAARLVDMMEADGLVSAGAAGKAREVLVDRNYFDENRCTSALASPSPSWPPCSAPPAPRRRRRSPRTRRRCSRKPSAREAAAAARTGRRTARAPPPRSSGGCAARRLPSRIWRGSSRRAARPTRRCGRAPISRPTCSCSSATSWIAIGRCACSRRCRRRFPAAPTPVRPRRSSTGCRRPGRRRPRHQPRRPLPSPPAARPALGRPRPRSTPVHARPVRRRCLALQRPPPARRASRRSSRWPPCGASACPTRCA